MNHSLRRLVLLTAAVAAAACSSTVTAKDAEVETSSHRLDGTAADSTGARGGGNLMGGN